MDKSRLIEIPIQHTHICTNACAFIYKEKNSFINSCKDVLGIPHMTSFGQKMNKSYINGRCSVYGTIEDTCVGICPLELAELGLYNPAEIVIADTSYTMTITYPLTNPLTKKFESTNGFTRIQVLVNIISTYIDIYQAEAKTTVKEIIPETERSMLKNRNETNGTYGIWGHDLSDLVIERLAYDPATQTLHMFIGS